jgi:hypothetical protein
MFSSIASFNHSSKRIGTGPGVGPGPGHPKVRSLIVLLTFRWLSPFFIFQKPTGFMFKRPGISTRRPLKMDLGYTSDSDVWRSTPAAAAAAAAAAVPPRSRSVLKPPLSAIDAPTCFADLDGGVPTVARQHSGRPRLANWQYPSHRRDLGDLPLSSLPYGHPRHLQDSTESLISVMLPETQPNIPPPLLAKDFFITLPFS